MPVYCRPRRHYTGDDLRGGKPRYTSINNDVYHGGTGGKLEADGFEMHDRMEGGSEFVDTGVRPGLSDEQIEAMWMRRLPTTPRRFLRLRLAYQAAAREARGNAR